MQPVLRKAMWLHSLAILAIAFPALTIGLSNVRKSYDDAYITYRYAYNFATGYGFVYNHGENYLATTAPAYGLLLGVLGLPNPAAIPVISGYLSALALLATGVGLYVYGSTHRLGLFGLLAAFFFVVQPMLVLTMGGEMLFQTALIVWGFVAYTGGRNRIAVCLFASAILIRPDAVFAVVAVGLHAVLIRRRLPWREAIWLGIVLAPWFLIVWFFYGTPLPTTLSAKLAQGASGMWPPFYRGAIEWLRAWTVQGSSAMFRIPAAPHAIRFVWLISLGIFTLWWYRAWFLPLTWVLLYGTAYSVIHAPFYHWYIVPVVLGLAIIAAAGIMGVVDGLQWVGEHVTRERLKWAMNWGLSVLVCSALAPGLYAQMRFSQHLADGVPEVAERLYTQTGLWLKEHTPLDASVGYLEIGYLGYYAQRRIIDPVGLINPGVAPYVMRRELTWAYKHYRPDYIVYNPDFFVPYLSKVVNEAWFTGEYHEVTRITESNATPLVVYKRVAVLP